MAAKGGKLHVDEAVEGHIEKLPNIPSRLGSGRSTRSGAKRVEIGSDVIHFCGRSRSQDSSLHACREAATLQFSFLVYIMSIPNLGLA